MIAARPEPAWFDLSPTHVPATWARPLGAPVFVNLHGDYTCLTEGYYRSLDAECRGLEVVPTVAACLDAYVVPIATEVAKLHGIEVPATSLVTDRWPRPPVLAYPVNPFSSKVELIVDLAAERARRSGLTYTGMYLVACQVLPHEFRIDVVRVVLGVTQVAEYAAFAAACFPAFQIPLMRVRTIVSRDASHFSGIGPLPFRSLTQEERRVIDEVGTSHA